MLKCTAMLMILAASLFLGMLCNAGMKDRISELESVICAIETVKRRIMYFLEPLDDIALSLKAENPLFSAVEEPDFSGVWMRAIAEAHALKGRERAVVSSFCTELGKTDREGQIAICNAMSERVLAYKMQAESERERLSRIATIFPVLIGLTIVIIFL